MKTNRAEELKDEGNTYFKQGDYDKALQYYGKAVEIAPDYQDAWNNIYLTLLRQERNDEAAKCKEILEKIAHNPKMKSKTVGLKQFSIFQKIFIVVVTILLVIAVVVATETLMGVGVKKSGTSPIENTMNSLVSSSPVSFNIAGNNSSGISIPSPVNMVSDSFDTVQNSFGAISPLGLDMKVNYSSTSNSTSSS